MSNILKPKDPNPIINDIIETGTILEKYALIIQFFNNDYDKIMSEFLDRGITSYDFLTSFITVSDGDGDGDDLIDDGVIDDKYNKYKKKIMWILSDILNNYINDFTYENINDAIKYDN